MAVADYSTTPADNTSISGLSVTDATVIDTVDNIVRQLMADVKAADDANAKLTDNETISGDWTFTGTYDFSGATVSGVNLTDGTYGDIVVSSSGAVLTINNNAVTLAKFQQIATDSFLGRDTAGTGNPEVLTAAQARTILNVEDGATAGGGIEQRANQATTSGTSVLFSSIPSDAKILRLLFNGTSTTGAADLEITLGDSGGLEVTGYTGYSTISGVGSTSPTTYLPIFLASAGTELFGWVDIIKLDSGADTWGMNGFLLISQNGSTIVMESRKTLSGTLTQLQVATSDAYDAGSIGLLIYT